MKKSNKEKPMKSNKEKPMSNKEMLKRFRDAMVLGGAKVTKIEDHKDDPDGFTVYVDFGPKENPK